MYDAIVVGARCAGSPLAMLLARKGHKVLIVDRATFPSDTISTHFIWQAGTECLRRWGLLDRVRASGCAPVSKVGLDVGAFTFYGTAPSTDGAPTEMYGPRRTMLDKMLIDAAAEAGAEVEQGFSVSGLTVSDGRVTGIRGSRRNGPETTIKSRMVIGADGRHSLVANSVGAEKYDERPVKTCCYYSYWSDLPHHVPAIHARPGRTLVTTPGQDGQHTVIVMFPIEEFDAVKSSVETHFTSAWQMVPDVADILRQGRQVERFYGSGDLLNYFRTPAGEGWALVGDAGCHKDPCTAQGISDSFRSAEWLADALHAGFSGAQPMNEALAVYHKTRDEHFQPSYNLTYGLAHLNDPPPPLMQALFGALRTNQPEADRFFGTLAGTVPIPEYFAPANMQSIVERSASAAQA